MRRFMILAASALLLVPLLGGQADAQRGFGGGGFRGGGGFGGGGFRAAGVGGGGWAGRPGWGAAGRWGGGWAARPGWGGGWVGHRRGWGNGWPLVGAAVGLGLASAAYYGSGYYPYDYGYGDCPLVRQQIWDGYGYRVAWVNSCGY
jgi:hypothetical protein